MGQQAAIDNTGVVELVADDRIPFAASRLKKWWPD
jgi:hypothetical protein